MADTPLREALSTNGFKKFTGPEIRFLLGTETPEDVKKNSWMLGGEDLWPGHLKRFTRWEEIVRPGQKTTEESLRRYEAYQKSTTASLEAEQLKKAIAHEKLLGRLKSDFSSPEQIMDYIPPAVHGTSSDPALGLSDKKKREMQELELLDMNAKREMAGGGLLPLSFEEAFPVPIKQARLMEIMQNKDITPEERKMLLEQWDVFNKQKLRSEAEKHALDLPVRTVTTKAEAEAFRRLRLTRRDPNTRQLEVLEPPRGGGGDPIPRKGQRDPLDSGIEEFHRRKEAERALRGIRGEEGYLHGDKSKEEENYRRAIEVNEARLRVKEMMERQEREELLEINAEREMRGEGLLPLEKQAKPLIPLHDLPLEERMRLRNLPDAAGFEPEDILGPELRRAMRRDLDNMFKVPDLPPVPITQPPSTLPTPRAMQPTPLWPPLVPEVDTDPVGSRNVILPGYVGDPMPMGGSEAKKFFGGILNKFGDWGQYREAVTGITDLSEHRNRIGQDTNSYLNRSGPTALSGGNVVAAPGAHPLDLPVTHQFLARSV